MFTLTEKGRSELARYAGASEDELRLTRRLLLVPVLGVIASHPISSLKEIEGYTGFSKYELTGILRTLFRLGLIARKPPGKDSTKEERRSWYMYQLGQRRGKKPESRTKEQFKGATARMMERYPEVAERHLLDWQGRAEGKWAERYGGIGAYRKHLRENRPEVIEHRRALASRNALVLGLSNEGLSQSAIAREVGMSQSSISRLLKEATKK